MFRSRLEIGVYCCVCVDLWTVHLFCYIQMCTGQCMHVCFVSVCMYIFGASVCLYVFMSAFVYTYIHVCGIYMHIQYSLYISFGHHIESHITYLKANKALSCSSVEKQAHQRRTNWESLKWFVDCEGFRSGL